ncbi:hypothetical protein SAMN05192574_118103 [Mucilaginibacter gossypiicola]|jgi:hypothetical protein|uniref:Coproporphyrinogen III oxidase n=2 Tax=Mucilaginibacter TaxID=423349 RepID=A0A5C1I576_9SPHI|nr:MULTISPECIES: hypothetical protein [Mucilaginibacter]QEM12480.1 hypothetical protein DEO27_021480 [Mucilaginibacter rubeus]SEO99832.1 hypothetical protein SAMN05192574_118103 [Mucilaginibacter gossypiicola]
MRKNIFTGLFVLSVSLIMACNGDHSARSGEDTAQAKHDAPSNLDTSKTTSVTGDASTIDNSPSGGTKTKKADTSKMDSVKR